MKIHPILLAGGSGTRLWPLSRKSYPKQFSHLGGAFSLFQASAQRLSGGDFTAPLVITGNPFRFIVLEQLAACEIAPRAVLIEPAARNTAAAIAGAVVALAADADTDAEDLVLVAPSDHVIEDTDAFRAAVTAAAPRAKAGDIVTFGITPTRPETGYGYLELTAPLDDGANEAHDLVRFVEKPDAETAAALLASGRYLWNAGIFLASIATFRDAFARHAPQILSGVGAAVANARADLSFTQLDPDAWTALEDVSFDYAVMEKAQNIAVMPYRGVWSDLGDWDAVWRESGPDGQGVVAGPNATALDCRDTLLRSESPGQRLVGIGLDDIVAVAMPDAVLVTRKSLAQRTREAVAALRDAGATQADTLPVNHRPWGRFESLAQGAHFQVKRILVTPGGALSLQSHTKRAEHWIVVEGTARVTIDADVLTVEANQSVYIPLGARHRLENPGSEDLILIEVQTGTYFGEDDIIRYDDVYGRE